jgi:hypothetical protein
VEHSAAAGTRTGRAALVALLLVTGVALTASPSAAAGDVSFDGEAGTLDGISASANATVTAGAARHGSGGLDIEGTAEPAFARWNPDVVPQGHTHASVRAWIRLISRGAGESVDLLTVQNARRVENFDFFVNGITGRFQWDLWRNDTDQSDFEVVLDRWYLVEAQVEFADGQYTAAVRIDGIPQGTIASTLPSTTVRALWVGAEPPKTHHQHYDDIALTVGDAPMGWLTTTPPTVSFTSPPEGAVYGQGEAATADFGCASAEFEIATCEGTVADGGAIATGTLGEHEFTVTATDAAGYSTAVTHHYTVVDETGPGVQIASPADGATFDQGEAVIADYACGDEAGGSGLAGCIGPVADGAAIDTTTLGGHAFPVTATDAAGNSRTVTHTYTVVDTRAPGIDLRSPLEGGIYARGSAVVADFSCADEGGGSGLASCVGTVADGAPIHTSTLGAHEFTVTATDGGGNTTAVTHTYTVTDQTDPLVELRRPVDGSVVARGEVVEADYVCSDEAGGSGLAGCAGDGPSGGPIDTSVLGAHEFTVTATDGAGNTRAVTHGYTVVDRTSPVAVLHAPADGAAYARGTVVAADYECFDEVGGSGLREHASCVGPIAIGSPIDTWTLGARELRVTATDAAGNVGWTTHRYTVLDNQPDNLIRAPAASRYAGDDVYGDGGASQAGWARVGRRGAATFLVRVENDTGATDRFRLRGGRSDRRWAVAYYDGTRNVTGAVKRGTFVTGSLGPDRAAVLRVVIRPTRHARSGHQRLVNVTATAMAPNRVHDTVVAVVRRR